MGKGPPAHSLLGNVRVRRAVITAVNAKAYTADAVTATGEKFEGIPIGGEGLGAEGQGRYRIPKVNSAVWLMTPSEGATPVIMSSAALATQMEEGNDEEEPNDYRMNRPVLNEGDEVVAMGSDGQFIIMRSGGVVEVGSTQVCRSMYLPLNDLIWHFCQNFELITTGGHLKFNTKQGDDSIPVEFNLQIKEFADGDPIIELGLGRIAAEDNESVVQGVVGEIVARLLINDRYRVWIDKSGNVQTYVHGVSTCSFNGPHTEFYNASFFEEIKGLFKTRIGQVTEEVLGNVSETIGGSYTRTVTQEVVETIVGGITRTVGAGVVEDVQGVEKRTSLGKEETIVGNTKLVVTGSREETISQGSHEHVVGRKSIMVDNGVPSGTGTNGFELTVAAGKLLIHDLLGEVVVSAGPSSLIPLAKIRVCPGGAVHIDDVQAQTSVEVNKTGVRMKTLGGSIAIDVAGTVEMGSKGVAGAVVTTLTHPVCYVTGAPILGCASCGAKGAPSPTPLVCGFVSEP